MSDRKFQIEVSTSFNPAGTQQAAQGLQSVSKATGEAGEKAETFNKHGREMHELLHKLNSVAPGLGSALKAILSPEAAPLIGVIVALELVSKLFEKIKADGEAFNKIMEEAPDFSGIKNAVESTAEAMDDATRKSEDFLASIDRIISAQKTVADNADALIQKLEHQKTVEDEIAKAKKDQVAAELELLKQKGQITPEQYDIAKLKLDSQSAREAAQREVTYLNREKDTLEHEREVASANVEQQKQSAQSAEARASAADNNLAQANQRHTHAKSEVENASEEIAGGKAKPGLQREVDDYRAKLSGDLQGMSDGELRDYFNKLTAAGSNTTMDEKINRGDLDEYLQLVDKLQALRSQQSGFAAKLRASETGVTTAKDEKSAADQAVENVKKEITDNANSVKTLTAKIDDLTRKLDEHKDDARVFEAQDRARRAQILPDLEKSSGVDSDAGAAAFTQRFLASQSRLQNHHGTVGDSQMVTLMNQLLQSSQESDGRTFALLRSLINHHGSLARAQDELARELNNVASREGKPHS